ncbi:MAG: N-acetylmuramoyl-L-alanine amidase [Leptospiraceae bacterium]|nr:N-acetylmuramoyl-L-alanine amidase [Leptospiraceae bacterium]
MLTDKQLHFQFPTRHKPGKNGTSAGYRLPGWLLVLTCLAIATACRQGVVHTVVIDPGHGGVQKSTPDDKWDPIQKRYLGSYLSGMSTEVNGKRVYEHIEVLKLARRLHVWLELTHTDQGWREFLALLKKFSDQKSFQRIYFDSSLTRTDSWLDHELDADDPDVNAPYRLYDYPDSKSGQMQPGRISRINQLEPELIVSLHNNPAGSGHSGGMAAVLAPAWGTFALIRKIDEGQEPEIRFLRTPWAQTWLITDPGWSVFQAARADTWVYFHGYRTTADGSPDRSKNRGIRQNMVQWSYADKPGWEAKYNPDQRGPYAIRHADFQASGPFFDRERSRFESWRRSGGPLGYGGDNHYASDELMRFAQYGFRTLAKELRTDGAIGPINPPYTSTYSLPTFSNAIVAYLEIAYLNRKRDRQLMTAYREELAQSLAVGIYSLFAGLELKPRAWPFVPDGSAINFEKYGRYFRDVSE